MRSLARFGHLTRRFFGSLSRRPPATDDVAWVLDQLLPGEAALWQAMPVQDRRHSILVTRRFTALVVHASRAEIAGALLHDVGKTHSRLSTLARVAATIIGPRTKRFTSYHDHETVGLEMLRHAGSDPLTLAVIDGTGRAASSLREADAV